MTVPSYRCSDCGQRFGGAHAFALHRTGEYAPGQRLCLTAGDMRAIGMVPNAAGFWTCAHSARPDHSTLTITAETAL